MSAKLNCAARLLSVFERVARFSENNVQGSEAWASILDVGGENSLRRAYRVASLLQAMQHESDLVANGLQAIDFSADTYGPAISKIEQAISPLYLSTTWNNIRQFVTPDVITALRFCAGILPSEESEISIAELDSIRNELAVLKSAVQEEVVSRRLRELVMHHLELVEGAIATYRVAGAKVFRTAGHTALGEIIEAKNELMDVEEGPLAQKLGALWESVNTATATAYKTEKQSQLTETLKAISCFS